MRLHRIWHNIEIAPSAGSGLSWLIVGCIFEVRIAMIVAIASMPPAAPRQWPIIDLVALILIFFIMRAENSPNRIDFAHIANDGRGRMSIDVVDLLRRHARVTSIASAIHRATPAPSSRGSVM